jgi:aldehyde dehydrogenase (NAD+)
MGMQDVPSAPTHAPRPVATASTATTDAIPAVVRALRATFDAGRTRSLEWRQRQLDGLERLVTVHEREIFDALRTDLGKPELEAFTTEVGYLTAEIALTRRKLRAWMRPERVTTPLPIQPGTSRIHREPLGVVLIIGPWNYPFQLVMAPLVGALAAGNCAVVKPSEVASATSALIARLVPEYLDRDAVAVVEGAVPETTALLAERFDHIFYTGNGAVGRIVMAAAAKHLTPVTLELGGKSPCIVDRDVDLVVAARRIVWGKFSNAGQTCVAPDYLLVHEDMYERVLSQLVTTLREFYGDEPKRNPDYGRVVNARHFQRLARLLRSGELVVGGDADEGARYIAPTVLRDVPEDAPAMQDEIFGPILPVLRVRDLDAAVAFVNARPRPLALYVFSQNLAAARDVVARTSSGGATINHVWVHLGVPELPFGGVGPSGMGAYHGRASFETFSHRKSVLEKSTSLDPPLLYPPYTEAKRRWIKRLL